jgi:hypothetical protein
MQSMVNSFKNSALVFFALSLDNESVQLFTLNNALLTRENGLEAEELDRNRTQYRYGSVPSLM